VVSPEKLDRHVGKREPGLQYVVVDPDGVVFEYAEGRGTYDSGWVSSPGHIVQAMSDKTRGVLAIVVAFVVLFSAMWEPLVSLTAAISALLLIGIYQLASPHR
jgi:hypothetical protein